MDLLIRSLLPWLLPALPASAQTAPRDAFFEHPSAFCGRAFAGRLRHFSRPADDSWPRREGLIHICRCSADENRIALHVGANLARTGMIRHEADRLVLEHDHRHEDGSVDVVTGYGGHTLDVGRSGRQTFPANACSRARFPGQGLEASIQHLWSQEIEPGCGLACELLRRRRQFRAEFNRGRPLKAPPAPWGAE